MHGTYLSPSSFPTPPFGSTPTTTTTTPATASGQRVKYSWYATDEPGGESEPDLGSSKLGPKSAPQTSLQQSSLQQSSEPTMTPKANPFHPPLSLLHQYSTPSPARPQVTLHAPLHAPLGISHASPDEVSNRFAILLYQTLAGRTSDHTTEPTAGPTVNPTTGPTTEPTVGPTSRHANANSSGHKLSHTGGQIWRGSSENFARDADRPTHTLSNTLSNMGHSRDLLTPSFRHDHHRHSNTNHTHNSGIYNLSHTPMNNIPHTSTATNADNNSNTANHWERMSTKTTMSTSSSSSDSSGTIENTSIPENSNLNSNSNHASHNECLTGCNNTFGGALRNTPHKTARNIVNHHREATDTQPISSQPTATQDNHSKAYLNNYRNLNCAVHLQQGINHDHDAANNVTNRRNKDDDNITDNSRNNRATINSNTNSVNNSNSNSNNTTTIHNNNSYDGSNDQNDDQYNNNPASNKKDIESSLSSIPTILQKYKKSMLFLSLTATLYIYSKYKYRLRSHARFYGRRRYKDKSILSSWQSSKMFRWIIQFISSSLLGMYRLPRLLFDSATAISSSSSSSAPPTKTASSATTSSSSSSLMTSLLSRATSSTTGNRTKSKTTQPPWKNAVSAPLAHLLAMAKAGKISKAMINGSVLSYLHTAANVPPSSTVSSSLPHPTNLQKWSKTTLPSNNPTLLQEILSTLLTHGCDDIVTLPETHLQKFMNGPAVMILPFAYLAGLYWIMRKLQREQHQLHNESNGLDDESDFSKFHSLFSSSDSKKSNSSSMSSSYCQKHTTTFDDVAGIDASLEELSQIVNYIRNPQLFHSVGASPPRGVLLYGPPGSGKTLLARAIAGEACRRHPHSHREEKHYDIPHGIDTVDVIDAFAVVSGSEFVETYVGRGAARVRSLFRGVREEARRNFEQKKIQKQNERKRWKRELGRWERRKLRMQRCQGNQGDKSDTGDRSGMNRINGSVHKYDQTFKERSSLGTEIGHTVLDAWEGIQSLFVGTQRMTDGDTNRFTNYHAFHSLEQEEQEDHHRNPVAIIFIDEIDVLAKQRGGGMGLPSSIGGGGCDEREQTLNQLLTEMDGFTTGAATEIPASNTIGPSDNVRRMNNGVIVIVIAATNRPEVLDPAILRPGRFDRHVHVPLPDAKGREAILKVHTRRIRLDPSVDLWELAAGKSRDTLWKSSSSAEAVASTAQSLLALSSSLSSSTVIEGAMASVTSSPPPTHKFSGADLKNVVNEAALLAVKSGSGVVTQDHLMQAVQKVRRMFVGGNVGSSGVSSHLFRR